MFWPKGVSIEQVLQKIRRIWGSISVRNAFSILKMQFERIWRSSLMIRSSLPCVSREAAHHSTTASCAASQLGSQLCGFLGSQQFAQFFSKTRGIRITRVQTSSPKRLQFGCIKVIDSIMWNLYLDVHAWVWVVRNTAGSGDDPDLAIFCDGSISIFFSVNRTSIFRSRNFQQNSAIYHQDLPAALPANGVCIHLRGWRWQGRPKE